MRKQKADPIHMLQGTIDMLILRTLLFGPRHGHTIAKSIERTSQDVLRVGHGSLYPALQRLERHCGSLLQINVPQQIRESGVGTQRVELGPHFKVDQVKSTLFESLSQPMESLFALAQTDIDCGDFG
jgi:hypothetical protein